MASRAGRARSSGDELAPPRVGIAGACAAVAVVSSFLCGYSICALHSCGELIPVVFAWCNSDWESDCLASRVCQSLVNASVYLGASGGAFLVGRPWLAARGSRLQICISDALFIVGGLSCSFAQGALSLMVGRFISGIGLGICAIAAPLYVAEVSPREFRGRNSTLHSVFIAVGIFASITLGIPQVPPPRGPDDPLKGLSIWFWRLLLGFPVLPALLQAVLFIWVVPIDPPSLLVLKGQVKEARGLLYRSYGLQPPEDDEVDLRNSKAACLELQLRELVDATTASKATPRIQIHKAICDPFLRCALLLGFGLSAFMQLCGINALISYSNSLFREAGVPPGHLTLASTVMGAMNVVVALASSKVVDHWSRRTLLLVGPFCQALAMGVITFSTEGPPPRPGGDLLHEFVAVSCLSFFVMSFSAGPGAVTWLYLSEIYPVEIRGSALSACGVINWLSCSCIVFVARFMSLHTACRLFGIISGVGFMGIYLWAVDTAGCPVDDSPWTPRSVRSPPVLLTPGSPKAAFAEMQGAEEERNDGAEAPHGR